MFFFRALKIILTILGITWCITCSQLSQTLSRKKMLCYEKNVKFLLGTSCCLHWSKLVFYNMCWISCTGALEYTLLILVIGIFCIFRTFHVWCRVPFHFVVRRYGDRQLWWRQKQPSTAQEAVMWQVLLPSSCSADFPWEITRLKTLSKDPGCNSVTVSVCQKFQQSSRLSRGCYFGVFFGWCDSVVRVWCTPIFCGFEERTRAVHFCLKVETFIRC